MYLNKYYVYAYLREDGTPYYIGKGCGHRINAKARTIPLPPKEFRIKLAENLTEDDAYKLEEEYILRYGRIDLGTGCLRNMSNGGKGVSCPKGRVPWNKGKKEDPSITAKRAAALKGKPKSREQVEKAKNSRLQGKYFGERHWNYGKKHSDKTKEKISNSVKDRWQDGTYSK